MVQTLQGLRPKILQIQSLQNGRKIDLAAKASDRDGRGSSSCISVDHFEDILLPSIKLNLDVVTTYNLVSELPIDGMQMVALEFETGSGKFKLGELDGNGDIIPDSGELYVYKVSGIDTQRQASKFTIHLASLEYFKNATIFCRKRYGGEETETEETENETDSTYSASDMMSGRSMSGIGSTSTSDSKGSSFKISDIVDELLLLDLDTSRDLDIEETVNTEVVYGNSRHPFSVIQSLCPKSIPKTQTSGQNGDEGTVRGQALGACGFLFYECNNPNNSNSILCFKSIDGLVSSTRVNTGDSDSGEKIGNVEIHGKEQPYEWRGLGAIDSNKLDANFRIINYVVEKNTDLRKAMATGMYANTTIYYNTLTHNVSFYDYDLVEQLEDKTLSDDNIPHVPIPNVSRLMFRVSNHGMSGMGERGLDESGGSNADRADVAKSTARYNLLFTQSLNISIPLNTRMKVGDIIICKFPRLTGGETKQADPLHSGKYLIRALRHHIEPNVNTTSLKLIRDSYGFTESVST
tara:strand:- start:1513 stop:3075 length:1563 start_codon:yes stop_codon:yes gene_type:complete